VAAPLQAHLSSRRPSSGHLGFCFHPLRFAATLSCSLFAPLAGHVIFLAFCHIGLC
jgi:hypothetical protein